MTARFLTFIRNNPVVFNSATGCTLCAGSDALAQRLEWKFSDLKKDLRRPSFDWLRFASAGLIGIFFGGFVYPKAYSKLDSIWKGTDFTSVLKKSIVEIATVGIFVNSVSMTARGLLVGRKPPDVLHHVLEELPHVTLNDIRVWLPYNLIAFSLIPTFLRPTTTAAMEASWQTYISWRSNDYEGASRHGGSKLERRHSARAILS